MGGLPYFFHNMGQPLKITASSTTPRPPRPILAQPYGRRLYVRLAGSVMTPHWLLYLSFSSLSYSTRLPFTVKSAGDAEAARINR